VLGRLALALWMRLRRGFVALQRAKHARKWAPHSYKSSIPFKKSFNNVYNEKANRSVGLRLRIVAVGASLLA